MREILNEQLNKELTRKQFLQLTVAAMLALFGFNNLLNMLNRPKTVVHVHDKSGHGFGSSKFGV